MPWRANLQIPVAVATIKNLHKKHSVIHNSGMFHMRLVHLETGGFDEKMLTIVTIV